ncbi:MAG TPA: SRPBCC domain-containing protein [Candidatus Binatia bacterium]|nr:SRPBCC domain-containing protein [Candidatus Binatia bacterium]
MQKIHASIQINAPKEKVWETMLNDQTYREWTKGFNPGGYYKGSWEEGSKIQFIGPSQNGSGEEGMVSRIKANRQYEYISIEHVGIYRNGVEDTTSEEARKWAPAYENYTFTEKDGGTELSIDMDVSDEYKVSFEEMWAKSLQNLKELSEK